MKIFSFSPIDESCILNSTRKEDSNKIIHDLSKGNYIQLKPGSINLVLLGTPSGGKQLYDIPWLYPEGLLCKAHAYELLMPFLQGCGKWNVMTYESEPIYYFSVLKELDALDDKLTDFIEHDGFVLGAKKYVFRDLNYKNSPIFRLRTLKGHYPVVTQDFVDFINESKFSGLKFKELK